MQPITFDELFDPNLYDDDQQVQRGQAYKPPTYEEIIAGSETLKLLPDDRDTFFQFVLKEQEVRLHKNIQDLYRKLEFSGAVEDLVHSELFKYYGYDDVPLNHQIYYALTRKYSNDPDLKGKIFFWRNNVMHGSKVKLRQEPPMIPLLDLDNNPTSLQVIMQESHEQKKLCVVMGGKSIEDYKAFARDFSEFCNVYFIYIKEAHFVERDQTGQYVDGWPIGYYDYEFTQHKSQQNRQQMAIMFKDKYQLAQPILQDVFPGNAFDETFGIWPDNLVVFKDSKLVHRGVIALDGSRQLSHSKYLEEQLPKLKY